MSLAAQVAKGSLLGMLVRCIPSAGLRWTTRSQWPWASPGTASYVRPCAEQPPFRTRRLCHKIAVALGFNLDSGRLDVSVHHFTGGTPAALHAALAFRLLLAGCCAILHVAVTPANL